MNNKLIQVEGPCDFSFQCSDYHDKCQATADELIKNNELMKSIIKAGMMKSDSPHGEHWHLAAALAGLVKERDKFSGIMQNDISSALDDCVELRLSAEQMRDVVKAIIAKAIQV